MTMAFAVVATAFAAGALALTVIGYRRQRAAVREAMAVFSRVTTKLAVLDERGAIFTPSLDHPDGGRRGD
jgi:hypothetical protein